MDLTGQAVFSLPSGTLELLRLCDNTGACKSYIMTRNGRLRPKKTQKNFGLNIENLKRVKNAQHTNKTLTNVLNMKYASLKQEQQNHKNLNNAYSKAKKEVAMLEKTEETISQIQQQGASKGILARAASSVAGKLSLLLMFVQYLVNLRQFWDYLPPAAKTLFLTMLARVVNAAVGMYFPWFSRWTGKLFMAHAIATSPSRPLPKSLKEVFTMAGWDFAKHKAKLKLGDPVAKELDLITDKISHTVASSIVGNIGKIRNLRRAIANFWKGPATPKNIIEGDLKTLNDFDKLLDVSDRYYRDASSKETARDRKNWLVFAWGIKLAQLTAEIDAKDPKTYNPQYPSMRYRIQSLIDMIAQAY